MHLALVPIVRSVVPGLGEVRHPDLPDGLRWGQADDGFDSREWMLVWMEKPTLQQLYDIQTNGGRVSTRVQTDAEDTALRDRLTRPTKEDIAAYVAAYRPRAIEAVTKWLL